MKNCDGCIACCNGTLKSEVYGEYVNRKNPCSRLCHESMNCSQYDERPEVCRNFQCAWLMEDDIPMWMKPSESGVLLVRTSETQMMIHSVNGMVLTADVFLTALGYASSKGWTIGFCVSADNIPDGDLIGGLLQEYNVKIGMLDYDT